MTENLCTGICMPPVPPAGNVGIEIYRCCE
jgi:hypothetical protein